MQMLLCYINTLYLRPYMPFSYEQYKYFWILAICVDGQRDWTTTTAETVILFDARNLLRRHMTDWIDDEAASALI